MRLVLASNNAKKLAELRLLFAPLRFDGFSGAELGLTEPKEPYRSFIENALVKARHAARHAACAAIADDSGLCVDALGGAPGVDSAHYAQIHLAPAERETQRRAQDQANNTLLLERLGGTADRRAHFHCTLVALRSADDAEPLIAVGRWPGEVLDAPRGSGGFGYDPLMFIPALGKTVAELSADVKNALSHRALAAQQMLSAMRESWHLA
ncbi:MAG: non-canonical purine NTP pyrophosphatase [Burkholderiaceae bacterium]